MENELVESTQPEKPEEPQVFTVARDINGTQFKRREFIEKAVITTAAVSVVVSGCSIPSAVTKPDVDATVNAAIIATDNSKKVTAIAAVEIEKTAVPPTAEASATMASSATPVPTDTPVPATSTVTPTPPPAGIETTISGDNVNFRSGPGTGYAPITRLPYGALVRMVSRLADSSWVGVALADPKKPGAFVEGWIKTNLLNTKGKDIHSLPVITNIPPTPTPLPGKYGNTSPGEKGIDYTYTDQYGNVYNYALPCGAAIPAGATCTCNCVTVPRTCSCVEHSSSPGGCSCNPIHYWYPN